jgi:hypothetical protein
MNLLQSFYAVVGGLSTGVLCCLVGFGLMAALYFVNIFSWGFGGMRARGIVTAWASLSVVASFLGSTKVERNRFAVVSRADTARGKVY